MVESYEIPSIDRREVLRYLGYTGQPLTPELDARIDEVVASCLSIARPRGCVRVFDVDEAASTWEGSEACVRLEGSALRLEGTSISAHLAGARAVGVMAVTIGMGIERELRRLALTDTVAQVIFDSAASTTVERAADAAEASLMAAAHARGLYTNSRFSPGYGDLPMSTQPALLATLDAQRRLGITLTSTLLMTPTKSVTALVGLFDAPQPSLRPSCAGCLCFDFCSIRPTGRTCRD